MFFRTGEKVVRKIFNQKIGDYSCDIKIKDCEVTVSHIKGDVSNPTKLEKFSTMVKHWCDFNKHDITKITLKY